MQLLTRAQKEGFFNTPAQQRMLDTDDDLTELLRRPDFKALRAASLAAGGIRQRR